MKSVIAVVLILFLSSCSINTTGNLSQSSSTITSPYSMGGGLVRAIPPIDDELDLTATEKNLRHTADVISYLNPSWVREEFVWAFIVPEKGSPNKDVLAQHDLVVDINQEYGISILGLITYTAPWSSGGNAPSTEEHYKDFAEYAAFLANRYKGRVSAWEIWNEPNASEYWAPEPDPENYSRLFIKAAQAIRKADPDALIVGPAVTGVDIPFITTMITNGCGPYMDIVSIHPYTYNGPEFEYTSTYTEIISLKKLLENEGLTETQIWSTEAGYPTPLDTAPPGHEGVGPKYQAIMVPRTYFISELLGITNIFWYTCIDSGDNLNDRENAFGLFYFDETPKPGAKAFHVLNDTFSGYSLVGRLGYNSESNELDEGFDEDLFVLEYKKGNMKLFALWYYMQNEYGKVILDYKGDIEKATTHLGEELTLETNEAELTIELTDAPIFIQGDGLSLEVVSSETWF